MGLCKAVSDEKPLDVGLVASTTLLATPSAGSARNEAMSRSSESEVKLAVVVATVARVIALARRDVVHTGGRRRRLAARRLRAGVARRCARSTASSQGHGRLILRAQVICSIPHTRRYSTVTLALAECPSYSA